MVERLVVSEVPVPELFAVEVEQGLLASVHVRAPELHCQIILLHWVNGKIERKIAPVVIDDRLRQRDAGRLAEPAQDRLRIHALEMVCLLGGGIPKSNAIDDAGDGGRKKTAKGKAKAKRKKSHLETRRGAGTITN